MHSMDYNLSGGGDALGIFLSFLRRRAARNCSRQAPCPDTRSFPVLGGDPVWRAWEANAVKREQKICVAPRLLPRRHLRAQLFELRLVPYPVKRRIVQHFGVRHSLLHGLFQLLDRWLFLTQLSTCGG